MLQDIFKTSIYNTKLSMDLKKLNKEINEIIDKDKGRKISNSGGYQSNNIDYKSFTQIYFLSEIIKREARQYKTLLGLKEDCVLDNMWINVNKYKDFNISHIHPLCSISGVFYVKCPKESGDIVFENTAASLLANIWGESDTDKYTLNTSIKWNITPQENVLLLFPSFLNHYVEPNMNKQERISISFNIK
tara:strand:+ start:1615 stop:2184 length:570 start_codon:yes stop_codon:yes gene_type:complete